MGSSDPGRFAVLRRFAPGPGLRRSRRGRQRAARLSRSIRRSEIVRKPRGTPTWCSSHASQNRSPGSSWPAGRSTGQAWSASTWMNTWVCLPTTRPRHHSAEHLFRLVGLDQSRMSFIPGEHCGSAAPDLPGLRGPASRQTHRRRCCEIKTVISPSMTHPSPISRPGEGEACARARYMPAVPSSCTMAVSIGWTCPLAFTLTLPGAVRGTHL